MHPVFMILDPCVIKRLTQGITGNAMVLKAYTIFVTTVTSAFDKQNLQLNNETLQF